MSVYACNHEIVGLARRPTVADGRQNLPPAFSREKYAKKTRLMPCQKPQAGQFNVMAKDVSGRAVTAEMAGRQQREEEERVVRGAGAGHRR